MPYTEFHYTPTGTGVISGKEVLEQTEDAINDLGGQISGDVQTAIDTANNALNTANTASADAQNAVNTANTAYTAATTAQNTANAAQNTASNALTAAQNAQNDVNALGNRVTTAEGNITQNTNAITGLTTRMGTAEGNITTLQNDVITAQGTATSAQNTATMARQQAYVLRYSSTAITDNSTIAYSTLDNTDNIKVSDKIIDSDGKIFSVVSIDSANETVTVGSALIDLALDANVMHLSGDETVAGIKTFSDIPIFATFDGIRFRCAHNSNAYVTFRNVGQADAGSIILSANDGTTGTSVHLVNKTFVPYNNNDTDLGSGSKSWKDSYAYHGYFKGQQQGDEYSGNARTNLTLTSNRDTLGQSGCVVDTFRENTAQGTGSHILGIGIKENSVRYEGCRFSWLYDDDNNGYVFSLRPTKQGTNQPIKYELGNSLSKWSTFNGINPGALSFPDFSNGIDISGYITTGSIDNSYTPPTNGWIWIKLIGSNNSGASIIQGDWGINARTITSNITNERLIETNLAVSKDIPVIIRCVLVTDVVSAKFYPCQGNV